MKKCPAEQKWENLLIDEIPEEDWVKKFENITLGTLYLI